MDGDGKDYVDSEASEQNSTGQIVIDVAANKQAMGYVSLGSADSTVKKLVVDGVEATAENILNNTYKFYRPFNIVVKDGLSDAAQDFIDFILSDEGQVVVVSRDCVPLPESKGAYTPSVTEGSVKVHGSSSIAPLMEKFVEAYAVVNPGVSVTVSSTDSGTGVSDAAGGLADIGMVSRDVRDSEKELGLEDIVICYDGIAIIVNNANSLNEITSDTVKEIFIQGGSIKKWEDLP